LKSDVGKRWLQRRKDWLEKNAAEPVNLGPNLPNLSREITMPTQRCLKSCLETQMTKLLASFISRSIPYVSGLRGHDLPLYAEAPRNQDYPALELVPNGRNREGFRAGRECDSSWPLGGGQRCMGRPYSEDLRRRIVAAVFARARRLAVRRRVRRSCSAGTRAVPRHRFRRASSRLKRSPRHSRYRRLRGAPFWHLFRRLGHYGHR
jgi:hypothetical protein